MNPNSVDAAGRAIAGLLTYNPGPGIYSRLERAIEAMPENVRVQELPGLLKRYKEGVPGWELKETDLDSVIAGRDVVPRGELLARVKERSPVYTHREIVLGGNTPKSWDWIENSAGGQSPIYGMGWQPEPSRLGAGISHGRPRYEGVGQGGNQYTEILLLQPGAGSFPNWKHHWQKLGEGGSAAVRQAADDAVAHARFDYHNDALRLNEVQSDLAIHNRKAREYADQNPQIHFGERLNPPEAQGLPFPMEDSYLDYLVARVALEWARSGKPALELASPHAISRGASGKRGTGMDIDKLDHLMHKMVAPRLERLGRRMGGMADDTRMPQKDLDDMQRQYASMVGREGDDWAGMAERAIDAVIPAGRSGRASYELGPTLRAVERGLAVGDTEAMRDYAQRMFRNVARSHMQEGDDWLAAADRALVDSWPLVQRTVDAGHAYDAAKAKIVGASTPPVSRRYLPSDEMRRRLIESGVGASLLAPLLVPSVDGLTDSRD